MTRTTPRTKKTQTRTPKKQPKTTAITLAHDPDLAGIIQRCADGTGDGYTLRELGKYRARALDFLAALLRHLTHRDALHEAGVTWGEVERYQAWSGDYGRLYAAVRSEVSARKLQLIEDEAFKWSAGGKRKGIYHEGRKIADEEAHSDRLHELLLRAGRPDVYGRAADSGSQPAVVINIDL